MKHLKLWEQYDGEEENDLIEYKIPQWAVAPLIYSDYSALSDEDEEKINKFSDEVVNEFGNALFMLPSDETLDLGFCPTNDIDNLGSDCVRLFIKPSK